MSFQIEIIHGHDSGSYFWIMPVRCRSGVHVLGICDVEEKRDAEISIGEENVASFLAVFFRKYFDKDLIWNRIREDCEIEFEWYLEHNFYTYPTIQIMLQEIQNVANLLKTDCTNPLLDEYKAQFSIYDMTEPDSILREEAYVATEERKKQMIEENIDVVIDFYHRFCTELSKMIEEAPDYQCISIMGP